MKKYSVVGQNVYEVKQLPHTENILICIATNIDNAIEIAATLNIWEKHINAKDEKTEPKY